MQITMKELLLIGESGFLGKELKKELIKAKNYNVSGTSKNVSSKHYFNLNEKHNLKLEKYSVVILLAAITNIQYCEDNPDLCFDTNVTSTIRFIDEAVKKGCFVIFLSSNAVFDGQKDWDIDNYMEFDVDCHSLAALPSSLPSPFLALSTASLTVS